MPKFAVDELLAAAPKNYNMTPQRYVFRTDCGDSTNKLLSSSATKPSENLLPRITFENIVMAEATWISTRSDSSFFQNDEVLVSR